MLSNSGFDIRFWRWSFRTDIVNLLSLSFFHPVMHDWRRRSIRCGRRDGQAAGASTEVKIQYTTDRDRERENRKRMTAGETETWTWAYTRSQRACPRQRSEHDYAPRSSLLRQPGSQGGSSSTLSQSDSTRDLVRFTLTPCSRVRRLCALPATLIVSSLFFPAAYSKFRKRKSRRRRDDRVRVPTTDQRLELAVSSHESLSVNRADKLVNRLSGISNSLCSCDSLQWHVWRREGNPGVTSWGYKGLISLVAIGLQLSPVFSVSFRDVYTV